MIIRKAKTNDSKNIAKFNVLLAKESENLDISYEITHRAVKKLISNENKGFYLVAMDNKKIIGQLMITFEFSDWNNEDFWWIQSVYVDKNFRKKGVFKKLLEKVKTLAKKNNVSKIRLYVYNKNSKAIDTYKALKMRKKDYIIFETTI